MHTRRTQQHVCAHSMFSLIFLATLVNGSPWKRESGSGGDGRKKFRQQPHRGCETTNATPKQLQVKGAKMLLPPPKAQAHLHQVINDLPSRRTCRCGRTWIGTNRAKNRPLRATPTEPACGVFQPRTGGKRPLRTKHARRKAAPGAQTAPRSRTARRAQAATCAGAHVAAGHTDRHQ